MEAEVLCVRGQWREGECVCEQGYTSALSGSTLHPTYCDRNFTLGASSGVKGRSIVHYSAMAFTVWITACSFIAIVSLLYILWHTNTLKKKITCADGAVQHALRQKECRLSWPLLYAELWDVQKEEFICVNEVHVATEKQELSNINNARVLYPYKPQDKDELHLRHAGDIITDVVQLEQGWCKGTSNGKTGFFPLAYTELFDSTDDHVPSDASLSPSIPSDAKKSVEEQIYTKNV